MFLGAQETDFLFQQGEGPALCYISKVDAKYDLIKFIDGYMVSYEVFGILIHAP